MARKLEQYITAFLSWNVYCLHRLHSSFFFLFVLIESIFFQRKAAAANATTQQHALGKRPGKMSQSQTRWKHAWQLCVRTFNPPTEDVILSLDCHSLAGRTEDGGWWMVDALPLFLLWRATFSWNKTPKQSQLWQQYTPFGGGGKQYQME